MPQQRPTILTVFATLHFVVGGLTLVCCGCAPLLAPAMQNFAEKMQPPKNQQAKEFEAKMKAKVDAIPGHKIAEVGSAVLNIVLALVLIGAGVGLLKMQPWARTASLLYAVVDIVASIGVSVFNLLFVLPVTQEIVAELAKQAGPEAQIVQALQPMAMGFVLLGLVVSLIYPITVLIVMVLPSTAQMFRTEAAGASPPQDDDPFQRDRWPQS